MAFFFLFYLTVPYISTAGKTMAPLNNAASPLYVISAEVHFIKYNIFKDRHLLVAKNIRERLHEFTYRAKILTNTGATYLIIDK